MFTIKAYGDHNVNFQKSVIYLLSLTVILLCFSAPMKKVINGYVKSVEGKGTGKFYYRTTTPDYQSMGW